MPFVLLFSLNANVFVSYKGNSVVDVSKDEKRRAIAAIGLYAINHKYCVIVLSSVRLLEVCVVRKVEVVDVIAHLHLQAIVNV